MADNLPTPAELIEIGRRALRSKLDPTGTGRVNLRAGSRLDCAISVMAALCTRLARHQADRLAAQSRRSARGEDLDVVATDRHFSQRKPAAAATGTLYLNRPASSTDQTLIPKGSRVCVPAAGSQSPVVFLAADDVSVAVSGGTAPADPIAVPLVCSEVGVQGNVDVANITKILDPLPDSTWYITSPLPSPHDEVGGGASEETDEELSARLDLGSPSDVRERGTDRAILIGTMTVPGVANATVIAPLDGTILVFAGDSGYRLSVAMQQAIAAELLRWSCEGVPCLVRPYTPQPVTVTGVIYMNRALSNYDRSSLLVAAIDRVKRYFSGRPYSDEYFVDAIGAAASKISDEVQTVAISAPAADQPRLPPASYQSATDLDRYYVDDTTIHFTFAGPQTQ